MNPSTSHVIEACELRRVFATKQGEVIAVDRIDLGVEQGTIFAFLGPNGAGKSTTIRMLVTLLTPSHGRARIAGFDVQHHPAEVRRRIGYVAQGGGSSPIETGREELVMQARAFGASRDEAQRRAAELIEQYSLGESADRRTGGWSGGQRRRLDIALGLVHRPQVVFLDEPTTGLDPQSRANMWEEIRRLRDEGVTVFLTTHYLEEADALADRVAIIDHGRIVADDTADELKRQIAADVIEVGAGADTARALEVLREQPFVRSAGIRDGLIHLLVGDGPATTANVVRTLDDAGLATTSITLTRPSLDDVFLAKTGRALRDNRTAEWSRA